MKPVQQSFGWSATEEESPRAGTQNLVIEASAGTGKTTAIVGQVLDLMLEREELDPARIVLMTFTEKAAGEIADRIRAALVTLDGLLDSPGRPLQWPEHSPAPLVRIEERDRERARRAVSHHLAGIDSLRSQTIHSFCQSLLRGFPIEAGLDPQFRIVQGFERALLYGQLYDDWLDAETRVDPRPEVIAEWELLFAHAGYLFAIRDLILDLVERRDLLSTAGYDFGTFDEVLPGIADAVAAVRGSQERAGDERADRMFAWLRDTPPPAADGGIDDWIDYFRPIATAVREIDLRRVRGALLKDALKVFRADEKKGTSIFDRLSSHRASMALVALARRFVAFLDREKRRLGVADFDDLLLRTLALLEDPGVLESARKQFDFIFVDEFQDTDRTQAAIIRRLATDATGTWVPGKLVIVGDPKQSIYGFRRADPETYYLMTQEMLRSGAASRTIRGQYRSDAPLIELVNALFVRLFPEGLPHDPNVFRPSYGPVEAARRDLRRDLDARFTMLRAEVTDETDRYGAEAEAVARWILATRERDGSDLRRFAILFRRLTKLDDYLDALQRHGIDYVLPPTRLFLDRPAAVDLVGVLRAIAFPFDRGAQISAARSPCFALTDREIVEGIAGGEDGPWSRFAGSIASMREASRHLTVAQLVDLVIGACGLEALYAAAADGIRHLRHLEHLRAIAFEFDLRSGGSVRQFVEEIQSRRSEPDEMEPALADETQDAVRILSVHAAKGLEFETVILPDLAFGGGSGESTQIYTVEQPRSLVMTGRAESISAFHRKADDRKLGRIAAEREEAEMRRLFYVAVTRAMTDVVFVCSFDKGTRNVGFLSCLTEALGVDRDGLAALWPERGRQSKTTAIGTIAFENPAGGEAPAAGRRPRLADPQLEREMAEGELAAPAIVPVEPVVETLSPGEVAARHAGARNRAAGILLHRFLESWDGSAPLEPLLRLLAAEAGVDAESVSLVRRRLSRIISSPTMQRLSAAAESRRELTVRFEENGVPVERRLDRLVREEGCELVVDFKSGAADPGRVAKDRVQVSGYCAAVSAITGRPCAGLIWYIDLERDEVVHVEGSR